MPSYDFHCNKCNEIFIIKISAEVVNHDSNWNKLNCTKCGTDMHIVFNRDCIPNFVFHGAPPVGKEIKLKREAEKCADIANQPFESATEYEEGMGRAQDLEKQMGKTPGTLAGEVLAPRTKEQKEMVLRRDLIKKEESRKARKKAKVKLNEKGTKL